MPKTPNLSFKKIIRIIKDAGFELDHTSGHHYIFYHPSSRKRVTVPFYNKDLPKGTVLAILKQASI